MEECPAPAITAIPPGERCVVTNQVVEQEICNEVILLDGHTCRQLYLRVGTFTILRVTVKDDTDEDAEEIEVSVIGTDSSLIFMNLPCFSDMKTLLKWTMINLLS